ncbi:hypothetical protein AD949_02275 [Acetobacter orleanensis]|nr:hypothetical protein AD949_02275 [Acetobacter orleanensis]PCD79013.1 hypothetical protein CO710_09570 [Acetobacter orleanensis]
MTDNSIALLARYAADGMEIRTSEEALFSAISRPSGLPSRGGHGVNVENQKIMIIRILIYQ